MFQVAASDVMFLTHENRTSAKTLIGLLPTSIDSDAKRLGIGAILLGRTQSPSRCL